MGNEQKIENLRQLIHSSVVLSVQEKEEWLSLVELMNDKQMAELMELLGQQAPPPQPTITPGQAPSALPVGMTEARPAPTLSHISNLPSTLMGEPAVVQPKTPARTTAAATILAGFGKSPQTMAGPGEPAGIPGATQPAPVRTATAVPEPGPARVAPIGPAGLSLPNAQAASALNTALLRQYGMEGLTSALKNLVVSYGYFAVMDNFEQSPLYDSYIRTGEMRLAGKPSTDPNDLSPEEFEIVTDLMQSLRINRL